MKRRSFIKAGLAGLAGVFCRPRKAKAISAYDARKAKFARECDSVGVPIDSADLRQVDMDGSDVYLRYRCWVGDTEYRKALKITPEFHGNTKCMGEVLREWADELVIWGELHGE